MMTGMSQQAGEEPSLGSAVAIIGQLAEQADAVGHYGLQDICLLIAEALGELAHDGFTSELSTVLDRLPALFDDYCKGSGQAIPEIMAILRYPGLAPALIDDEYELLESQLTADIGSPDGHDTAGVEKPSLRNYISSIGVLAEQAAADEYYGLQDVCLLVVEALEELSQEDSAHELPAVLDQLPGLFNDYCNGCVSAVHNIINILRHPALSIALAEDEYALLESQLAADIGVQDEADAAVAQPISKAVLELVELLVMEAALIDRLLDAIAVDDPESAAVGLEYISDELGRYINASQMAGFEGLMRVCEHVDANVRLFREDINAFGADRLMLLQAWIVNVKDYLSAFSATDAGLPLIAQLGAQDWPLPLAIDMAAAILTQIKASASNACGQEQEARKQLAAPEDISLALPDDVNPELLDILLHELPVQTRQFSGAIQRLQENGGLDDLEIAQRVAHTVKGAANTVGIRGIAELTHYLEDILVACTQARKLPGNALLSVLVDAADCLEGMSESVAGATAPPDEALAVLQTVLDWANRIDEAGIGAASDYRTDGEVVDTGPLDGIEQPAAPSLPEPHQAVMVRVDAGQMEDLFKLAGENIILNTQANERLRRMKTQLQAMEMQLGLLRQLGDELEQLIDLKDLSGRSRLNEAGFDALEMDQYNELHTAGRRMVEAAFDIREMTLDAGKEVEAMSQLLEDQQSLVNETQEKIMQTRLVPVASIVHRLQRGLRQTCRLTGKPCELTVSGEHLMIDGDTLNAMIDPLMHLLRNAVDHGIESEQQRLSSGKTAHGNITVDFDREGNDVVVCVRDDGSGLDYVAIRAAAERCGAIQAGQAVSDDELARHILRPNFSTRTQTTQTSGRGVGMDAVHFQVLAQGGSLALQSVHGQGLSVTMKIPLPLSRAHALLTQVGPYRLAVSSRGILQILFAGAGTITNTDNEPRLLLDGDSYPAVTLGRLLKVPEYRKPSQNHRAALLVQNDGQTTAVLLDAITGSLDIVIKDMGYYIKKVPGFSGAAIMGDGSVAPVLDIPELLRTASDADGYSAYLEAAEQVPASSSLPTVLVVDDSLSQRRALEQLLQDAGFQVRSARDGIEAVEQLAGFRPDIVLTDLEMPRMNGIELTSHIRARENLKTLPVIMITSRTTQTHRKMAEDAGADYYLVKPVREDDLLMKIQGLIEDTVS